MAPHEAFALKMFGIDPAGGGSICVAVRVAGRVAGLQTGLLHAQAAEIVAEREESDIRDKTTVEGPHRCGPLLSVAGG
jgi:hypothetical protein